MGNEIENYVSPITLTQMLSFGFCHKKIVSDLGGSRFNEVGEGMQVLGVQRASNGCRRYGSKYRPAPVQ